jgi:D-alanyl-D-alanine carboxypeptidase (penicillin-binding protein 5/6)
MKTARLHPFACLTLVFLLQCGGVLRAEKEDLAGPPIVTAKTWAVMDAVSGELIASHLPDQPVKAASTTKMMTCLTVLRLAEENPAVLEEMIELSEFAAATKGSRAELATGEKLRVADALYALMLPSGNDCANAIAEHFHPRLPPPGEDSPAALTSAVYKTRANFIAQMNRNALELGMKNTVYLSAIGDGGTTIDPTTTARDLLILARQAMGNPRFREVVGTRSYSAPVGLPEGGSRTGEWENTNELLEWENYDGVKTGTTVTAGRCLVASGRHEDRHLFVCVLGSAGGNARYADTRNLFRWAWNNAAR